MVTLYQDLPNTIDVNGKEYRLNLAFDVILKCIDMRQDEDIPDAQKMKWIARSILPWNEKDDMRQKAQVIERVFQEIIFQSHRKSSGNSLKTFDFSRDADLIFASFMQAYHIDLFEQQGKMHWWKFESLFHGLPAKTKMREVMDIRSREMPVANGKNTKEIQALQRLKQYYAIPCKAQNDYESGLNALFDALSKRS